MTDHQYSIEELRQAVAKSYSYAQVMRNLNIPIGNWEMNKKIKEDIKTYNIVWIHYAPRHNRGLVKPIRTNIETYLNNEKKISSDSLKRRLFKEGIKEEVCEICKNSEWMGLKIPLHLHHINESHFDNTLSNLQILCANCHGQKHAKVTKIKHISNVVVTDAEIITAISENYNVRQVLLAVGLNPMGGNYDRIRNIIASKKASLKSRKPKKTKVRQNKIQWPETEELRKRIWETPTCKLAEELKASSSGLRRHCKKMGIEIPKAGYWQRRSAGKNHEQALVKAPKTSKPKKRFLASDLEIAIQMLNEGFKLRRIAARLGFCHQVVSHHLKANGHY